MTLLKSCVIFIKSVHIFIDEISKILVAVPGHKSTIDTQMQRMSEDLNNALVASPRCLSNDAGMRCQSSVVGLGYFGLAELWRS